MSTHGRYDASGGRPTLRFERTVGRPIDAVWRTISEPGEMARWFPTEVRGELTTPGARLQFAFPDDDVLHRGEVLEIDPPRLLAFTWFDDVLRVELEAAGDGATTLRFSHEIVEIDAAARTMAGWTVCLDRLEAAASGSGEPSGPDATAQWQAHYRFYVTDGVPSGAPVPADL
jgi:uncharacterized protein YndB with AHSA1/START domain